MTNQPDDIKSFGDWQDFVSEAAERIEAAIRILNEYQCCDFEEQRRRVYDPEIALDALKDVADGLQQAAHVEPETAEVA